VSLIILAAAGIGGYLMFGRQPAATVQVERGTVVKAFYATGVVRPDTAYTLKARVAGTLSDFYVRENDHVTPGQLVAQVSSPQLQYEVDKAQAALREAQAQAADDAPRRTELQARLQEAQQQMTISAAEVKRLQGLFDTGNTLVSQLDQAQRVQVQWTNTAAALESQLGSWKIDAARQLAVAEADLKKAQANLADTRIASPVDGIVLQRYVEPHEVVALNEPIVMVARADDRLMQAAVDEEFITRTHIGQVVEMQLYAFSGTPLRGHVTEILPTADPVNKTYEVKVAFDDPPPGLRVGMTAELNFIEGSPRRDVLVVPSSAVLDGQVYRPSATGYEAVPVVVGVKTLEKYEIVSGLKAGDVIVADAKAAAEVKLPPPEQVVVPTRNGDRPAG
jgi:RND family efflux transporter MFP subunit